MLSTCLTLGTWPVLCSWNDVQQVGRWPLLFTTGIRTRTVITISIRICIRIRIAAIVLPLVGIPVLVEVFVFQFEQQQQCGIYGKKGYGDDDNHKVIARYNYSQR